MNLSSCINILGSHLAPALTQPWVCGPTPLKQLPCLVGVSTFDLQQPQMWPVRMRRGLLGVFVSSGHTCCKELLEKGSRGVIPGSLLRSEGESISRGLGSACSIAQRRCAGTSPVPRGSAREESNTPTLNPPEQVGQGGDTRKFFFLSSFDFLFLLPPQSIPLTSKNGGFVWERV